MWHYLSISTLSKTGLLHSQPCPLDLVPLKLPRLPDLPITPTCSHGPTYPVAGIGPPAHWGSPRNLGRTCRGGTRTSSVSSQGTQCLMVDLGSQKFSRLPSVGWEGSVLWKDFRHQRVPNTGPW